MCMSTNMLRNEKRKLKQFERVYYGWIICISYGKHFDLLSDECDRKMPKNAAISKPKPDCFSILPTNCCPIDLFIWVKCLQIGKEKIQIVNSIEPYISNRIWVVACYRNGKTQLTTALERFRFECQNILVKNAIEICANASQRWVDISSWNH